MASLPNILNLNHISLIGYKIGVLVMYTIMKSYFELKFVISESFASNEFKMIFSTLKERFILSFSITHQYNRAYEFHMTSKWQIY